LADTARDLSIQLDPAPRWGARAVGVAGDRTRWPATTFSERFGSEERVQGRHRDAVEKPIRSRVS